MCAEFIPSSSVLEFARAHGIAFPADSPAMAAGARVLPHTVAPVLVAGRQGLELSLMQFSLVPSWSKERRVPFATFNARLDTLATKPTWKAPFALRRALVPIDAFIEPCYSGEYAGTMVRFFPPAQPTVTGEPPLWGAALYDCWVDPETQKPLLSFALITDLPGKDVEAIGHDREPLFIKSEQKLSWLDPALTDTSAIQRLLPTIKAHPALTAAVERPMKPGWENRCKG